MNWTTVIPAQAGILILWLIPELDTGLRRYDVQKKAILNSN